MEEGTNYCTTHWCTTREASIFTYREGEDHGTYDLCDEVYTAPVLPDAIPADVTEVGEHGVGDGRSEYDLSRRHWFGMVSLGLPVKLIIKDGSLP